jgi:hypothetical protein
MQSRKMQLLVLGMIVTSALVALVPSASAQQNTAVSLTVTPPTDSVKPLQGALTFGGTVTVTWDNSGQANLVGIPLTYQVTKQPPWASVTIIPATDVIPVGSTPSPGATSSASKSFTVEVTASDQAPAFQPDTIQITATASPTAPQGHTGSASATVPITASYFSILDAELAQTVQIDRPQTAVIFPLKLTNLGNANTKVTFAIDSATANLQVPIPVPIVLQSKQAGGSQISSEVPLTIQTPYHNGYMNEVGVVTYKITSAYALDPKQTGDSTSVSVVITTKGFYVPGPEPLLVVGLIAVSAVVARRFRKE